MTIDTEIVQVLNELSLPLKQELLRYAKNLIESNAQTTLQETEVSKKRRSGILKGTFVLPLPHDFDAPLEDFQEYIAC
jgi:hypothetical protein